MRLRIFHLIISFLSVIAKSQTSYDTELLEKFIKLILGCIKRNILKIKIESLSGLYELLCYDGDLALTIGFLYSFTHNHIISTFKLLKCFLCMSRIFKTNKSKVLRLAFIVNHNRSTQNFTKRFKHFM